MIQVCFKKLTEGAVLPVKTFPTDNGFDLFANEDTLIYAGETKVIKTGNAVKLPPGFEAKVRPHSRVTGLSYNWIRRREMDKKFTMINNYGLMRTYIQKVNLHTSSTLDIFY